jgi:hypothetical protein
MLLSSFTQAMTWAARFDILEEFPRVIEGLMLLMVERERERAYLDYPKQPRSRPTFA